ncbi:MAG: TIGR03790 family protein [bacterium]|nr:TIGR03790 family protein [bacterium]
MTASRIFIAMFLYSFMVASAIAGGGPENVVVVVNEDSDDSKTIAAEYIQLRKIPDINVIRLNDIPNIEQVSVEVFRKQILKPILKAIEDRGLKPQIDCVAYSADFPWAIDARGEFKGKKVSRIVTPLGSINGMTYLYQRVLENEGRYLQMSSNRYMRRPLRKPKQPLFEVQPTQALHADIQWNAQGEVVESEGESYLLSTMLAVTSGRGNSVEEAIDSLRRSVRADATNPDGTFYFMVNSNVRSTTREPAFESAVDVLKKMGRKAEINDGILPKEKSAVAGAMIGTASFDWSKSNSTMTPGAICEHLTSYGGVMRSNAGQTPLTAFIKHGAAGSSGTVTEPYAIQAKFPLAFLHVHYARGCSLAESFYQSVHCPYQLLIVGDPLCQPWAKPPQFGVEGIANNQTIANTIDIQPTTSDARLINRFDLFIDGVRTKMCKPTEAFSLDTKSLADGDHEIRIVAIGSSPIECQSRLILTVKVANAP